MSGANLSHIETIALRRSLIGYLVFGSLGVTFSVITGSDAILLDGVYSLICAVIAVAAMQVSRCVLRPQDDLHPFGYATYEPLLNAIKGALILSLCILSAAGSLASIIYDGGREPAFGWAIVYSISATTGCFWMAAMQRRSARQTGSSLLAVEARSWVFDGAISGAVGLVFVVALVMERTDLADWVPYVDPVMTLLLVLILLPVPLGTVMEATSQLLFLRPARAESDRLEEICREVLQKLPVGEPKIRVTRIGRAIYILISILLNEDEPDLTTATVDEVRIAIAERIAKDEIAPIQFVDVLITRRSALM